MKGMRKGELILFAAGAGGTSRIGKLPSPGDIVSYDDQIAHVISVNIYHLPGLREPAVDIVIEHNSEQLAMGRWDFWQHWRIVQSFGESMAFACWLRTKGPWPGCHGKEPGSLCPTCVKEWKFIQDSGKMMRAIR